MEKYTSIAVYVFAGFLESGKTKFIQETLEDPEFDSGENTLLLICEEGEEEYDASKFAFDGISAAVVTDLDKLNPDGLAELTERAGAGRVLVELNGMWKLDDFFARIPENWQIFQCICCADGTTALSYAREKTMRALFLDKISKSELMVFNRAETLGSPEIREELHALVRQASRACDITYEFTDGSIEYDEIEDPLPFDIESDEFKVEADDFGIWYMDCMEDSEKYDGKTVNFLAQIYNSPKLNNGSVVTGRFAMTCCMDDIEFVGFPCEMGNNAKIEDRTWVDVKAKIEISYHEAYRAEVPVLKAIEITSAEKPQNDVVKFS